MKAHFCWAGTVRPHAALPSRPAEFFIQRRNEPNSFLSAALPLPAHPPKGTDPEITEGETEAEGDQNARRTLSSGLVLGVFARQGEAANERHRKENKARYLKPKLVQDACERACRRPQSAKGGGSELAFSRLLPKHPSQRSHSP
jgi:hypothetical protein